MQFLGWIRYGDDGLTGWRRRRLAQKYSMTAAARRFMPSTRGYDPETGKWIHLTPMKPKGPLVKVEFWLRRRGWMPRLVGLLAWIDERKLGR